MDKSDDNDNTGTFDRINQLEEQVKRGSFFTHTRLSQLAERLNDIEVFLYGLADVYLDKGITTPEALKKSIQHVRDELREKGEMLNLGLALRVDNKKDDVFIPVNCDERLPVCQAVCCKLGFALSVEEVESGQIKWDLGRPYYIRPTSNGYCVHNDATAKCCTIYNNRPAPCRRYSCAKDKRIWKDFDQMVLNQEWIEQHLDQQGPFLAAAMMENVDV